MTPILTNSSMQMLLKHAAVVDKLQTIFNLTDEEKILLDRREGPGLEDVAIKVNASHGRPDYYERPIAFY